MSAERYGSKTDVLVKLILVFFISLLSFSIGTFVGKKFSDNQHKLSQLEPGEGERGTASVSPYSGDVKPKDVLNEEEIKKLAEEFIRDDESKTAGPKPPTPPTHETTDKNSETHEVAKTHAPSAPSEVAERIVAGKAPVAEKQKIDDRKRIPQSLPKEVAASTAGKFTVQVASYPDENEAQKVASDLKGKGFSAFYVAAKIIDKKSKEEKTWYRVSVGLFTTQKEAEAYKRDLLAKAKVTSAIVQKITN
jgi:cell division protein FtsN